MDYTFNEDQEMIRDLVREFADGEVRPLAAELDDEERFPEELIPQMGEIGLFGIPFPEDYGGAGLSNKEYVIAVEELSKACASTGVTVSAHTSLCCWPIYKYGTEEQKHKYLPPLLTGEKLGAFGLTEAGAGTDAAMQRRY